MENTCIVCGKKFKAKTWNQVICGEECKKKRQYECYLKLKNKQEERKVKRKKPMLKKLPLLKSKVITQAGDPKWVKDYASGNRLMQIAMLARALTDYNITNISYGVLSTKWDTKQYYSWESTVIALKRKDYNNAKNKSTEKEQSAEQDNAKEKNTAEG